MTLKNMKNLIHKYIGFYLIPKYKRLVSKSKSVYNKYINWKYGIRVESIKQNNCCHGNCKCEQGKDI
jgi:hypothetical protein